VKRILGTLLTECRLAGDNPNWTEVLGMVAATINSQHGRGKDDVSSFEAVYGQVLNHDMSCSKAEARQCWTLPQFLKVTNDEEFAEYAAKNIFLMRIPLMPLNKRTPRDISLMKSCKTMKRKR